MDGEQNGAQNEQGTQQEQGQQQAAQQPQQETQQGAGGNTASRGAGDAGREDFEAQLAERDSRIAELEGQIAEAAKSAEAAEGLRAEIALLKEQTADERIEFGLKLADVRNVKAAKALLGDHKGDVDALKEAEPWLFAAHAKENAPTGKTGLPNAGAAKDSEKQMNRWRDIAGLNDDDKE